MKEMGIGKTIGILCDADCRMAFERLRVKVPKLTLGQAEEWWNEQCKKEASFDD